ncbi:TraR/DksA family transcriptional regulator [Micromonosporaceae bacterium Da 78-11]
MPTRTTDTRSGAVTPGPQPKVIAPCRPSMSTNGVRDENRDLDALVWDLTVHQMYRAFAQCVFPIPAQDGESGGSEALARVRVSAARHAAEDIRAALRRIESGTYGTCQQCGCIIAADRMRSRPTSRWCAGCQV